MKNLQKTDPQIYNLVLKEERRIKNTLELIPSNNFPSKAVLEALGTIFNYKYSEGYPGRRYYQGQEFADYVETLAQERAKKLFGVPYVNVQALSGSPANMAVYFALLNPGDTLMGLKLGFGGHLTHGLPLNISGKFYRSVQYELQKDGSLDFDAIEKMAFKEKPKLIICGFTAFPRVIDFKKFADIADKVGAYLMADIAHIAGLVVAGVHPSPVSYAHIVTTTTHKTLRGPRGALIMVTQKGLQKNPDLPKKIDSAIIPGLQGGPHDNQTAAIAVSLKEAATPAFRTYGKQIVKNSKALAAALIKYQFDLVSGGTDNHLILIDLRNKKINGAVAALALEVSGIVTNKNAVPNDVLPPFYPSGVRIGTPAVTTRGMKEREMVKIARFINQALEEVKGEIMPTTDKEARSKFWKDFKSRVKKNKNLLAIKKEVTATVTSSGTNLTFLSPVSVITLSFLASTSRAADCPAPSIRISGARATPCFTNS
ncbi:MAG: serine hydroxymethyltransferase [Candidatus Yanofskybacteria bacterium]|nr:serine hydroxymethyltransferase [Candidatus Yanofskybacteria bacterium]